MLLLVLPPVQVPSFSVSAATLITRSITELSYCPSTILKMHTLTLYQKKDGVDKILQTFSSLVYFLSNLEVAEILFKYKKRMYT